MQSAPRVADGFAPYFTGQRVMPHLDQALMKSIFELRFEVYCQECGFLPAEEYPDARESDAHDEGSEHFCALNLQQELAGYVRLVPPDQQGRFPFQAHCQSLFGDVSLPEPDEAREISRLMVRKHYRRRRGDSLAGVTLVSDAPPPEERRNDSPQILLSMFRQMYAFSVSNDIRYWYAAMERSLARALLRLGFVFHPIGPATDYYGPVAPYVADLRELEMKVGDAKPDLLEWMREPLT